MSLKDIASTLEGYAEAALAQAETAGEKLVQELEPVVESAFSQLVSQFGELAVNTVVNLMTEAGAALSGTEKQNLTATTIVDAAEKAGVQVLAADVTALAKNAFTAVQSKAPPLPAN